jgi:hypothetical protein
VCLCVYHSLICGMSADSWNSFIREDARFRLQHSMTQCNRAAGMQHVTAVPVMHTTIEELREAVFSVGSMQRHIWRTETNEELVK